MCTPGKKGVLQERRGVLYLPSPPLGETLMLLYNYSHTYNIYISRKERKKLFGDPPLIKHFLAPAQFGEILHI